MLSRTSGADMARVADGVAPLPSAGEDRRWRSLPHNSLACAAVPRRPFVGQHRSQPLVITRHAHRSTTVCVALASLPRVTQSPRHPLDEPAVSRRWPR